MCVSFSCVPNKAVFLLRLSCIWKTAWPLSSRRFNCLMNIALYRAAFLIVWKVQNSLAFHLSSYFDLIPTLPASIGEIFIFLLPPRQWSWTIRTSPKYYFHRKSSKYTDKSENQQKRRTTYDWYHQGHTSAYNQSLDQLFTFCIIHSDFPPPIFRSILTSFFFYIILFL